MSTDDIINKYLGVETEDSKPESKPPAVVRKDDKDTDVDNDHDYSREAYYDLIQKGQEAIDGILSVAKEGEHPRAYEVAGQLIKNVADTTDKLADLQKKIIKFANLQEICFVFEHQLRNAVTDAIFLFNVVFE